MLLSPAKTMPVDLLSFLSVSIRRTGEKEDTKVVTLTGVPYRIKL